MMDAESRNITTPEMLRDMGKKSIETFKNVKCRLQNVVVNS